MVTTEQVVRGVGLISLATAIVLALKTLNDATNELKIVGDRATGWFTITRKPKTKTERSLSEGSGTKSLQSQGQVVGDAVAPDNIDQARVLALIVDKLEDLKTLQSEQLQWTRIGWLLSSGLLAYSVGVTLQGKRGH
ncbi:hypothetical protein KFL_003060100 [Klebsormidium nitens]|uniref:Uncharacterized protein n=1 Tax=Klebsormidium nitens TaxID=105231 RepID=A0A1Y1ICB2_KLENI|nr:hypothetical protein KFL_003060100 [Klebsormidium nitens]|eukprot:GAQ86711.1 hypothetical protein KFL_003060100 [Klebsormidium nitens]